MNFCEKNPVWRIESASVTIFLTMVFLLFFSMVGVMLESARTLSSDGYFRVAARSAAMTVFGDYNRELFQEYGFFAYGGYDGIGIENLNAGFLECLKKNLSAAPAGKEHSYSDLYRFSEVESEVEAARNLMEKEVFYAQIEGCLKREALEKAADQIAEVFSKEKGSSVKEKLAITRDYENGRYEDAEMDEKENDIERTGDTKPSGTDNGTTKKAQNTEEELRKDAAGGNPLDVFSEFTGNGILNLVCDENDISSRKIPERESSEAVEEMILEKDDGEISSKEEMGAADFLTGLIDEEDMSLEDVKSDGNRIEEITKLFLYASEKFADYTKKSDKTAKYGMEYLVAGREKENLNLSYVVNRILVIRLLLSMGYVMKDPVLQEKSLTTATILAGFTGLPPVVSAVQYTILMILSFEEACVDVTALLEGKELPYLKNAANFQMRYEEICICTKELLKRKARCYQKAKKGGISHVDYQSYLYTLILFRGEETIRSRMGDLIQFDLRERYNQTFTIDTCICASTYRAEYCIPHFLHFFPLLASEGEKTVKREQEVKYEYKSK